MNWILFRMRYGMTHLDHLCILIKFWWRHNFWWDHPMTSYYTLFEREWNSSLNIWLIISFTILFNWLPIFWQKSAHGLRYRHVLVFYPGMKKHQFRNRKGKRVLEKYRTRSEQEHEFWKKNRTRKCVFENGLSHNWVWTFFFEPPF